MVIAMETAVENPPRADGEKIMEEIFLPAKNRIFSWKSWRMKKSKRKN